MDRRYKEARKKTGMTAIEAAAKLEVSQATIGGWEAGRKTPSIEGLEKMADLYHVTADYLLGRPEAMSAEPSMPIDRSILTIFDGRPIWSEQHGWVLVNAAERMLICKNGQKLPFFDTGKLFAAPQHLALPPLPHEEPLTRDELLVMDEVWVEPISTDQDLCRELRGWYRVKSLFVENSAGSRFLFDTYGSKWLAFENNS